MSAIDQFDAAARAIFVRLGDVLGENAETLAADALVGPFDQAPGMCACDRDVVVTEYACAFCLADEAGREDREAGERPPWMERRS